MQENNLILCCVLEYFERWRFANSSGKVVVVICLFTHLIFIPSPGCLIFLNPKIENFIGKFREPNWKNSSNRIKPKTQPSSNSSVRLWNFLGNCDWINSYQRQILYKWSPDLLLTLHDLTLTFYLGQNKCRVRRVACGLFSQNLIKPRFWFALYVFTGLSNSFMWSFLSRPFQMLVQHYPIMKMLEPLNRRGWMSLDKVGWGVNVIKCLCSIFLLYGMNIRGMCFSQCHRRLHKKNSE